MSCLGHNPIRCCVVCSFQKTVIIILINIWNPDEFCFCLNTFFLRAKFTCGPRYSSKIATLMNECTSPLEGLDTGSVVRGSIQLFKV